MRKVVFATITSADGSDNQAPLLAASIREYGGSLTTTMFASTYKFLNKDKREAVGEIVEMKANKKLEEDESDEL